MKRIAIAIVACVALLAFVAPSIWADTIQGPSCGQGGSAFSDDAVPEGARVVRINIRHGDYIDAIQTELIGVDGKMVTMPLHGGNGGTPTDFTLDTGEYITDITGKCGSYLDSLQIHTNKRTSQVFGGPGGASSYQYSVNGSSQIIGFFGRSGKYVDGIGIITRP